MKLFELKSLLETNEDLTVRDAPAPGQLGQFITTAQRRKILGVGMSRVRQYIMEKRIKTYHPVPGRRDNFLKLSEVDAFAKKSREITGRPPEGEDKSKDKDKDK